MNRPIHFASEYGYIEILELLIKNVFQTQRRFSSSKKIFFFEIK